MDWELHSGSNERWLDLEARVAAKADGLQPLPLFPVPDADPSSNIEPELVYLYIDNMLRRSNHLYLSARPPFVCKAHVVLQDRT